MVEMIVLLISFNTKTEKLRIDVNIAFLNEIGTYVKSGLIKNK